MGAVNDKVRESLGGATNRHLDEFRNVTVASLATRLVAFRVSCMTVPQDYKRMDDREKREDEAKPTPASDPSVETVPQDTTDYSDADMPF